MRKRMPGYVARGRFADAYSIPFREMIPLKLRTTVSAKGESKSGAYCVQEMSVLLACMKRNEFESWALLESCRSVENTAVFEIVCVDLTDPLYLKSGDKDRHCSNELASFQKCVTETEAAMKQKQEAARRGDLAPGERKLSHHQVTALLKKYPG